MSLIHISSSPLSSTVARRSRSLIKRDWRLSQSESFVPMLIKCIKVADDNPLQFNTIFDTGDTKHTSEVSLRNESKNLLTYFIESFSLREDDVWVNFSAYEPQHVISKPLLPTLMGQNLLEQDIILKRLATSLVHPDTESGQEYWARLFEQLQRLFGSTVPLLDAFPKIWVVPGKAVIYEKT